MKKLNLLILCSFLSIVAFSQVWTEKSPLPAHGRRSALGCSANGDGYYGLGTDSTGTYVAEFWRYDTLHDYWFQLSDFPGGARTGAFGYTIQNKIYVCFGFNNNYNCLNDMWEYDPATLIWTQKASFPGQARFNAAGFVINDSLLYIGTGSFNNSNSYLFDFWMYNPSTNTWTQKADFPGSKRMAATAFEIDGMGYLGSGLYDASTPKKDFWKYNPNTDSWSSIPDLPGSTRYGTVSFVLNNCAYVGTGDNYINSYIDFYKYDPQSSNWSYIGGPNTNSRFCGIGFTAGHKAYMGFGWNNTTHFADFWAFDPSTGAGFKDISENGSIIISPNPCNDNFTISFTGNRKSGEKKLSIYNTQGKLLRIEYMQEDQSLIDIPELSAGIYFLRIESQELLTVRKLVRYQ